MNEPQLRQAARDDLELLQTFRAPDGLATSCYLFLDGRQLPDRGAVATLVSSMISGAKADLDRRDASREARASVHSDLAALDDWVQQHLPERSGAQTLAWFSCSAQDVQIARWLPVPLPNRLILAEDFDDSALVNVLRSLPRIGLVVIDHASAHIYHTDGSRITEAASFEPDMQPRIRAREAQFGVKARMPEMQFGRGNIQEKRLHNRRNEMLHHHVEGVVPQPVPPGGPGRMESPADLRRAAGSQ